MERAAVEQWVSEYERAWRTAGTEPLSDLFTPDISYLPSPWARPLEGLDAVEDDTAVVRVTVDYGEPLHARWRDLWVVMSPQTAGAVPSRSGRSRPTSRTATSLAPASVMSEWLAAVRMRPWRGTDVDVPAVLDAVRADDEPPTQA